MVLVTFGRFVAAFAPRMKPKIRNRTMLPQLYLHKLLFAGLLFAATVTASAQKTTGTKRHLVEINTTAGRMVVELYNETPLHRDNFLKLVREHYYDSTLFHRVIPGFMIQGGDPDSRKAEDRSVPLGQGGPGYTIPAEIIPSLIHRNGALAAARQGDDVNPGKRSSGSQFYIVQGRTWRPADLEKLEARVNEGLPDSLAMHYTPDQIQTYWTAGGAPHLDGGYTVFGQVLDGIEVLDLIANQPCDGMDRPLADVRMWMRVLQ